MSIIYDPSKTCQEMADAAGLSITAVYNFLQRNNFDHRKEHADYLTKLVGEYFANHPDATIKDATHDLQMTPYLIQEYRKSSQGGKTESKRKASKKHQLELSVNGSDSEILRSILHIYLHDKRTFDCDLTFGRGGFYSDGLPVPDYRYDKFLFGDNGPKRNRVKSLDEAESLPDNIFGSVVIDLPIDIDNDKKSRTDAFESLNKMFDAYHDMIALASRLLKPGGILVFKTVDFVLRNDEGATYCGQWATDHAIDYALEMGFDLTDRFILARRQSLITSGSAKVRSGLKHGYFLVFTKL